MIALLHDHKLAEPCDQFRSLANCSGEYEAVRAIRGGRFAKCIRSRQAQAVIEDLVADFSLSAADANHRKRSYHISLIRWWTDLIER